MKRKRDDLVNLELPTSMKKRMKGRREKEETQDLDARKVPMMKDQMTMNEGLQRDQELMSPQFPWQPVREISSCDPSPRVATHS